MIINLFLIGEFLFFYSKKVECFVAVVAFCQRVQYQDLEYNTVNIVLFSIPWLIGTVWAAL